MKDEAAKKSRADAEATAPCSMPQQAGPKQEVDDIRARLRQLDARRGNAGGLPGPALDASRAESGVYSEEPSCGVDEAAGQHASPGLAPSITSEPPSIPDSSEPPSLPLSDSSHVSESHQLERTLVTHAAGLHSHTSVACVCLWRHCGFVG